MKTIQETIDAQGVTMRATRVDSNPMMNDSRGDMSHWLCSFKNNQGRKMRAFYSMGPAHVNPPKVADVLDCLASDAGSVENARTFEEWASELGYSADSREAERIFKNCDRLRKRLLTFMGDSFEALLFETERL